MRKEIITCDACNSDLAEKECHTLRLLDCTKKEPMGFVIMSTDLCVACTKILIKQIGGK